MPSNVTTSVTCRSFPLLFKQMKVHTVWRRKREEKEKIAKCKREWMIWLPHSLSNEEESEMCAKREKVQDTRKEVTKFERRRRRRKWWKWEKAKAKVRSWYFYIFFLPFLRLSWKRVKVPREKCYEEWKSFKRKDHWPKVKGVCRWANKKKNLKHERRWAERERKRSISVMDAMTRFSWWIVKDKIHFEFNFLSFKYTWKSLDDERVHRQQMTRPMKPSDWEEQKKQQRHKNHREYKVLTWEDLTPRSVKSWRDKKIKKIKQRM